jgi:hypothetical protein
MNLNLIIIIIIILICTIYFFSRFSSSSQAKDCQVSDWISEECDPLSGSITKKRIVVSEAENGGKECPPLEERIEEACKRDCQVSEWQTGECDRRTGTQTKTRNIIRGPLKGGKQCPVLEQQIECARNCQYKDEVRTCNDGNLSITREITVSDRMGGNPCPLAVEYIPNGCPRNCKLNEWDPWIENRQTGLKTRTRTINTPAERGGSCDVLVETIPGPKDCETDNWTDWRCDRDTGEMIKTRNMIKPEERGGNCILKDYKCSGQLRGKLDDPNCTKELCAKDCKNNWGQWSCDRTVGKDKRTAISILEPAERGGTCEQVEYRDNINCPIDCQSTIISTECNRQLGLKTIKRNVLQRALRGGTECPGIVSFDDGTRMETTEKIKNGCERDCNFRTEVTNCNPDTGLADAIRYLQPIGEYDGNPANGGNACPPLNTTYKVDCPRACNGHGLLLPNSDCSCFNSTRSSDKKSCIYSQNASNNDKYSAKYIISSTEYINITIMPTRPIGSFYFKEKGLTAYIVLDIAFFKNNRFMGSKADMCFFNIYREIQNNQQSFSIDFYNYYIDNNLRYQPGSTLLSKIAVNVFKEDFLTDTLNAIPYVVELKKENTSVYDDNGKIKFRFKCNIYDSNNNNNSLVELQLQ